MGILEKVAEGGLKAVGLGGIFDRKFTFPPGPDFPEGLKIIEFVNGVELKKDAIILQGNLMPFMPFEFGGEQKIVKDYYPGNSEPVVQVLGAREDDVIIKGKFKAKRLKHADLRTVPQEYQELVDAMRLRGNLVKITLGDDVWRRYGFIEKSKFKLNQVSDIEYEITFLIIGFNAPTNCKFLENPDDDLIRPNKELIARAQNEFAFYRNFPQSMPRTLTEFLNDQISAVAGVINLVTNFVEGALTDIENIQATAGRAVGLIKNARATISRSKRRLGQIPMTFSNLGKGVSVAGLKTAARYNNADHIHRMMNGYASLAALLIALQLKYAPLAKTIPLKRHRVVDGDNLQRLAIKYYNNQDLWEKIYEHNKLQTTKLVIGSVLEIPKA